MKRYEATLYIVYSVIGIQLIRDISASGSGCPSNSNLHTCQNKATTNLNSYNTASNNTIDLLASLAPQFQTSESCDFTDNKFGCSSENVIHILHGFYGLITGHTCTKQQETDTCMAPRNQVLSLIPTTCDGAQTCNIPWANNRTDPCKNTSKVLIVYYLCVTPTKTVLQQL